MNNRTLVCMAMTAGILSVTCQGRDSAGQKGALPCDPLKLDALVGTVSLSLGTNAVVKKAMPCLLGLWRENRHRGGLEFYLSNAFLLVMEENPQAFFSVMGEEGQIFEEWLRGLPDLSFTWSGPPPCDLERKRKQLIALLEHSQVREPKALSLKQRVIKRLSSIKCRQID